MRKFNKAIRHLEQRALKGSIISCFQLFEYYSVGKNVEQNEALAKDYLEKCFNHLKETNDKKNKNLLKIKNLILKDFRSYSHVKINFDENITILVGNNGAGKTSIVEALAIILSWINNRLEKVNKSGALISYSDIRNESEHYAEIIAEFEFEGTDIINGSVARSVLGSANKKDGSVHELRFFADLLRTVNSNFKINLPLFAYYSVERSHSRTLQSYDIEKVSSGKNISRFEAYDGALLGLSKFNEFLEWFIVQDNISQNEDSHSGDLLAQIEALEDIVDENSGALWSLLQSKKSDYEKLSKHEQKDTQNVGRILSFVKSSLYKIIPSMTNIFVDRSSGRAEVKVIIDNRNVNIYQASHGQKILISLIAGISRRLVMLNPFSEFPLEGSGIILIDEVELHLHPEWQQSI